MQGSATASTSPPTTSTWCATPTSSCCRSSRRSCAAVCDEIAPHLKPRALVISVAAGVPLAVLEAPPAARGRGSSAPCPTPRRWSGPAPPRSPPASNATDEDLQIAERIFDVGRHDRGPRRGAARRGDRPVGQRAGVHVPDHRGALRRRGKVGLSRYNALALAAQTVLGSAKLLIETGEHPGHLKDMVTSPGGTAIAGLHTLEAGGLRTTLINAVEAATKRSRELGEAAREALTRARRASRSRDPGHERRARPRRESSSTCGSRRAPHARPRARCAASACAPR